MSVAEQRTDTCPGCSKSLTAFAPRPGSLYRCPLCGNLFNVPYDFYGYDCEHKGKQVEANRGGLKDTMVKRTVRSFRAVCKIHPRSSDRKPKISGKPARRGPQQPIITIDEAQP